MSTATETRTPKQLPDALPVQHRYYRISKRAATKTAADDGQQDGLVPISFSSDTPIKRMGFMGYWWYEILNHSPEAVVTDRLKEGIAVLVNHDPNQRVGILQNGRIEDANGRGDIKFNSTTLGQSVRQEVDDGTLPWVSVGYIVHEENRIADVDPDDDEDDDYLGTYQADRWEPVETSLVAVPADRGVGVGRDQQIQQYPVTFKGRAISPKENKRSMASPAVVPQVEIDKARQEAQEGELRRVRNITALGTEYRSYVTQDQENKWIKDGTPETDVRSALGNLIIARHKPVSGSPAEVVDLTDKEKRQFSVVRAAMAVADKEKCFEREVSDEIAKRMGRQPEHGGLFVPTSLPTVPLSEQQRAQIAQRAPLTVGSPAAGGLTVQTEVMPLIEILRNKIVARRMGATLLSGLRANLLFPRQITAGQGFWMAENPGADVTEQDLTFGSFTMSPKTIMALQKYSRQLMAQSTLDIEALVRNDIMAQIAIAIDTAVLNGPGTGGQPLGILGQSGIDVVALGANGAQPTFANVVQQETDVATANADIGSLGYVTTPGVRGRLKQTPVLANTIGVPVWSMDKRIDGGLAQGEVNGYPAMASNQVPSNLVKGTSNNCHAILFGDWSSVLIGEWGAMEVMADPYTLLGQAMVRIVAWDLCDTNLRYVASWSVVKDALP